MNVALYILDLTPKGVQVATAGSTGSPFWLPRSGHVEWVDPPRRGELVTASVPEWLAAKHRQLVGDVAFERVRHANDGKANTMTDRPEDAGRGALFKNDQKEKPSHPDYKGDVTIRGHEFWISALIKTSEKTGKKFMSLAFRQAEEQAAAKPKQQPAGSTFADDSIPFAPEWRG
jgi:hypothetical protein